ncbi:hypothetical protein C1645_733901 [Glomus cerebriforme]|uniref:Uncharacterized protein n=1 Tax=Glomus cerebriforme TaxID=658196 RepID=A0A397TCR4_9GLOM|nr:hypothetical protein C1645_733901 [Glomus cerebriforme]
MEQHFCLFKNFLFFSEQEKVALAKHTLLLVSNLDLSIARFIGSSDPSNVLLIWLIRNLLKAQDEEIQNIQLSFSSPELWTNIKTSKLEDTTNINNTSISNTKYDSKYSDVPSQIGIIPKTGKDPPPKDTQHVDDVIIDTTTEVPVPFINKNMDNTETRLSYVQDQTRDHIKLLLPKEHVSIATPMQDITLLAPINVTTNNYNPIKDSDLPSSSDSPLTSSSIIPMDTSSSNDTLLKKANKKKKKKSTQDLVTIETPADDPLHVPTDMLIDVTEYISALPDTTSYKETT